MAVSSLKSGPAMPFTNSVKGVLGNKTRLDSINTSIRLILTTPKGHIVYDPKLGSHVPLLVFDPLDDATQNLLFYYTVNDLEEQEPRIKVTSVQIVHVAEHHIRVWIGFMDVDDESMTQHQAPLDFRS